MKVCMFVARLQEMNSSEGEFLPNPKGNPYQAIELLPNNEIMYIINQITPTFWKDKMIQ